MRNQKRLPVLMLFLLVKRHFKYCSAGKTKYIVLILCGLLLSVSCNKKKTTTYYIDGEFKEWVLFKKNSYWVYWNEKKQVLDSLYINVEPRSGLTPPKKEGFDQFEQIYYDISNGFLLNVVIQRDYDNSYASLGIFYPDDASFPGLSSSITAGSEGGSTDIFKLVEKIDTMFLNNNKFTNVFHTRSNSSYYDNLQNDYYYVRNVGLVKFSIKTNSFDSTWSLVRWHTIQ